ncbi:hypothetical protein M9H77_12943 [Catharanthus roseus]|uniref:Uncharacterized protein n=1 Tax=Catharanthus roseus TaxID=4058 RepID=A0ACC0BJ03_CATRO|nr:hypothetical protein M9H77_12943 [Catharanthus roseus]
MCAQEKANKSFQSTVTKMEEVPAHVHPGPVVPDVLTRQHEHRSGLIWSWDNETCFTELQCRRSIYSSLKVQLHIGVRLSLSHFSGYKVKKESLEVWILREFTSSEIDDDLIFAPVDLFFSFLEVICFQISQTFWFMQLCTAALGGARQIGGALVILHILMRDVPYNLTFYPPNMNKERGRKQYTRFQEEMDYRNPDSPPRCGRCSMPGHNRKNYNNPVQAMYKFVFLKVL